MIIRLPRPPCEGQGWETGHHYWRYNSGVHPMCCQTSSKAVPVEKTRVFFASWVSPVQDSIASPCKHVRGYLCRKKRPAKETWRTPRWISVFTTLNLQVSFCETDWSQSVHGGHGCRRAWFLVILGSRFLRGRGESCRHLTQKWSDCWSVLLTENETDFVLWHEMRYSLGGEISLASSWKWLATASTRPRYLPFFFARMVGLLKLTV